MRIREGIREKGRREEGGERRKKRGERRQKREEKA